MDQNMQKIRWGILIENDLYRRLELAENEEQREEFIKQFSEKYNIPIVFVREKIESINKKMKEIKGEDYQER